MSNGSTLPGLPGAGSPGAANLLVGPRRKSRARGGRNLGVAAVLLLPTMLLIGTFGYLPPISAIYNSFFDWDGINEHKFVGLGNFIKMGSDPILLASLGNLLILFAAGLITRVGISMVLAEALFRTRRSRLANAYRVLVLIPIVIPGIVTLLLWQYVYSPYGLLNDGLSAFGASGLTTSWLRDPNTALAALIFVGFPWVQGVYTLILLSGLLNIDESIHDAADLDGAHGWRRYFGIHLPLMAPQLRIVVVLEIIGGIQGYGAQLVLTKGGPGYATMVPGMYMYQTAFDYRQMGYACAIGVAMFIVIFVLSFLNIRAQRRER